MTFGEKLKNLREAKGLSQEELAKALGVSRRTVSNYESGHRYPRYRSIYEKLAALLDTDINYLRTENEEFMEEVGQQFNVTRERIRQIEAKALRKLKHPSRSKKLRSFLDN